MDQTREGLAKLIGDLLDIAKVAMPPKLYAEDPRVKRASAYLVALGRKPDEHRVPNTGPDPLEEILGEIADLRAINGTEMVLDWDLVDGILAAQVHGLSTNNSEALNFIVREWLTANGYLTVQPDQDQ
jgi:hypothetical protein